MLKEKPEYTIPMYGLPYEIATAREVRVRLEDGADTARVIAAMKEQIPALDGHVFRRGEDRLEAAYKFNVNGKFYYDGQVFQVHPGDKIALLMPVSGG
jgi:molybdopterin converting factor small subunit